MLKIIAVCACPMGLAHTFMAAEAIERAALELGHFVKVETQGADGIQNELTTEDIESADIIIHSVSITPENLQRFEGREVYEVDLKEIIRDANKIIQNIVDDSLGV